MSVPIGYTPAQAAPLLGKHPQTVRRMCAARQIEAINTSMGQQRARWIITEDAIKAWRRNHAIPARSTR